MVGVVPRGTAARWLRVVSVWTVGAAVPLLLVVEVGLHLHTGGTTFTGWWIGSLVLGLTLVVPGVLVAARRPGNAVGWLLCAAALLTALAGAGREYLAFGVLGGAAPGHLALGWLTSGIYLASIAVLPLTLMLFPDGRPLPGRAAWLLAMPIAVAVLGPLGQLFAADADAHIDGHTLRNPAGHVLPVWLPYLLGTMAMLLFFVSVLIGVAVLVVRYRRADAEVRRQMKWVMWAGGLGVLELASELIPGNDLSRYTGPLASTLVMGSVCVAILWHRLFDIDLVINRTLVFGLLSIAVVGLYLVVVTAVDTILGKPVDVGPGLLAAAVVALAFGPARTWLQRAVDRLLYGERRNPYRVMSRLGERLESAAPSEDLAVVVDTVRQALKLRFAELVDVSGRTLARTGAETDTVVGFPLGYQGTPMGRLLVATGPDHARLTRAERRLIEDLARPIGAAVHAVRLSGDLQASRRRLVSAKEEERRRLRRDLHDGLGPKLAALGLKVDAAHALSDERPEASKQLMGAVKDEIRTTIDDIRRLVHGLRPPALDELGLVGALRDCAARLAEADGRLRTSIVAPTQLPLLPAAVEVAAYAISTEALTNVVKHAGATRCEVTLTVVEGDALVIRVCDDGVGLSPGGRAGVGTSSMRERAEELGGSLRLSPGDGGRGLDVVATIPCGGEW